MTRVRIYNSVWEVAQVALGYLDHNSFWLDGSSVIVELNDKQLDRLFDAGVYVEVCDG